MAVKSFRVDMVQVAAGPEVGPNLEKLEQLLAQAGGGDLVALPEVFSVRGGHEDYVRAAEPIPGPTTQRLGRVARRLDSWVLAGSIIEKDAGEVFNASVLLDRAGEISAVYRKIHLFEASLGDGTLVREADTYGAGNRPVLAEVEGWRCGLSICYDVRFPELYRFLSAQGAHVLFVPANFTQRTGRDHWEVLLRARAIENQCYVIAPDQCGTNVRTDVTSHGHSLAVGPWGEILCDAGDGEGVTTVRLDPMALESVRARIPVLAHRRTDVEF